MVPKIVEAKKFDWSKHSFDALGAILHSNNMMINLNRRSDQIEMTKALINGGQLPTDEDHEF
jgi:hypothetical protein